MEPAAARAVIVGAQVYAAVGLAVAAAFVVFGVGRIDPRARGAFAFRLLLVPGIVVLWPAVAARWRRLARAGGDRRRGESGAP